MELKTKIISIGMPKDWLKSRNDFGDKIIKGVLQQLAKEWHNRFLPQHFVAGAAQRYNYKARTIAYKKRKERVAATRNPEARLPLVWSGDLKRQTVRMAILSGTAKKATARMQAPRYVHMYAKGGNHPHIAGELTRVTRDEADILAKMAEALMTAELNNRTETTTGVV